METKILANNLAAVACKLAEDEFFKCDIVVCATSITCWNWKDGMITMPAFRNLPKYCELYDLLFYVDLEDKKLVIHG